MLLIFHTKKDPEGSFLVTYKKLSGLATVAGFTTFGTGNPGQIGTSGESAAAALFTASATDLNVKVLTVTLAIGFGG